MADHRVASGTCCKHLEVSVTTAHASKTQHKKRKTPSDGIVGGGHSWVWLCAGGLLRVVHAGVWCGLWCGQGWAMWDCVCQRPFGPHLYQARHNLGSGQTLE